MRTRVCVRDVETNVLLVEVLQRSFSFRQNELAAEELSVVSTSFPQKALSVPYTRARAREEHEEECFPPTSLSSVYQYLHPSDILVKGKL